MEAIGLFAVIGVFLFLALVTACARMSKLTQKQETEEKVATFINENTVPLNSREESGVFASMQGTFRIHFTNDKSSLHRRSWELLADEKNFPFPLRFSSGSGHGVSMALNTRQVIVSGRQFSFLPTRTTGTDEYDQGKSNSTEHTIMKIVKKNDCDDCYYILSTESTMPNTGLYGSNCGFCLLKADKEKGVVDIVDLATGFLFQWKNININLSLYQQDVYQQSAGPSEIRDGHREKCRGTAEPQPPSPPDIERDDQPPPSYAEACV